MKHLTLLLFLLVIHSTCNNKHSDKLKQARPSRSLSEHLPMNVSVKQVASIKIDSTSINTKYYVWCLLDIKSRDKIILRDYLDFNIRVWEGNQATSRGLFEQIPPPVDYYKKALVIFNRKDLGEQIFDYYNINTKSKVLNNKLKQYILNKEYERYNRMGIRQEFNELYKDQITISTEGLKFINPSDSIRVFVYLGIHKKGIYKFVWVHFKLSPDVLSFEYDRRRIYSVSPPKVPRPATT